MDALPTIPNPPFISGRIWWYHSDHVSHLLYYCLLVFDELRLSHLFYYCLLVFDELRLSRLSHLFYYCLLVFDELRLSHLLYYCLLVFDELRLGSTSYITDVLGTPVQYIEYLPFGEIEAKRRLIEHQNKILSQ